VVAQNEKILAETKANLERGRAVATGIGLFLVVVDDNEDLLLRRRLEEDSLYGQDLSGKWEMTGGGVELVHFEQADSQEPEISRYVRPVLQTLAQELEEEAGLKLVGELPMAMTPAFLYREYERNGEPRATIDLAFSMPAPLTAFEQTETFHELMDKGELMFVPRDKLPEIDIVSPRTRFLIEQALVVWDKLAY